MYVIHFVLIALRRFNCPRVRWLRVHGVRKPRVDDPDCSNAGLPHGDIRRRRLELGHPSYVQLRDRLARLEKRIGEPPLKLETHDIYSLMQARDLYFFAY